MQNIQDKEFDQLFRDRFDGAETEPSDNLWGNIETQLGNKPKRVFPVYWVAAALCAAAVTAGLLFRQPEKGQAIVSVAQTVVREHRSANKAVAVVREKPSVPVYIASVRIPSASAKPAGRDIKKETKKDLAAMQPLALIVHPDHITVSVRQKKEELPEPAKETPEEQMLASTAASDRNETTDDHEVSEKHRGIRNIGDLVNYVVNKLDKREEKMLKFETNDDESTLIGINIGMIRYNRKDSKQ